MVYALVSTLVIQTVLAGSYDADGSKAYLAYDGHGALSAGASSRLLIDYPEPQRTQVGLCADCFLHFRKV